MSDSSMTQICEHSSATCEIVSIFLPSKVGHVDLFFVSDQGSLLRLRAQEYKSLCASVTISAACMVDFQTRPDTHTHAAFDQIERHNLMSS